MPACILTTALMLAACTTSGANGVPALRSALGVLEWRLRLWLPDRGLLIRHPTIAGSFKPAPLEVTGARCLSGKYPGAGPANQKLRRASELADWAPPPRPQKIIATGCDAAGAMPFTVMKIADHNPARGVFTVWFAIQRQALRLEGCPGDLRRVTVCICLRCYFNPIRNQLRYPPHPFNLSDRAGERPPGASAPKRSDWRKRWRAKRRDGEPIMHIRRSHQEHLRLAPRWLSEIEEHDDAQGRSKGIC